MKSLFLFALLTASNLMASTIDMHSFPILDTDSEENFRLQTVQTKTAYRHENVARTCYRTEFAGYRHACDYYPEVRCYETRNSARVCNTLPVWSCRQFPQYREVAYTCYKTITTPYEVFDHNVTSHFNIKVTSKPKEPSNPHGCQVIYTMEGVNLSSKAECAEYLILSKLRKSSERHSEDSVVNNFDVQLKLLDAKTSLAPLNGGLADMRLEGNTLSFRTGDITKNSAISIKLFIERKRLLKSDSILIDRKLIPGEFNFYKLNDRYGVIKIDLQKLIGGINPKKKHVIKAEMNIDLEEGVVLNTPVPELSAHAEITVNN